MLRWIERYSTRRLACSRAVARAAFGAAWTEDERVGLLYCGIDLEPFRVPIDRCAVRDELGLATDDIVIGHVGSFLPGKNHEFLLDVAAAALRRDPRTRLLLIGDGPLRQRIELRAQHLGLAARVRFAGSRRDVPRLLRGAVDVFVFPSLHEGLPLACLEAQAAGRPVLVSTEVTEEIGVVASLVERVPLSASAEHWAARILDRHRFPTEAADALAFIAHSPFELGASRRCLERWYC
jgi:glycosyltransferase involved in cell wall biosynthesis